jgi:hypothetical protein
MAPARMQSMSIPNLSILLAAIFLSDSLNNILEGANTRTQTNRYSEPGLGITSPLVDCYPKAGCTKFSDAYPALYVQMVSARSLVIGLAADEVDPSVANKHFRMNGLNPKKNLPIESLGHSRVTVGFDGSEKALNELRIHVLLTEPLLKGQRYAFTGQMLGPQSLEFTYHPGFTSPSIQVNQVGYLPQADKQAFAGIWLGTAGPMPIDDLNFYVTDTTSGQIVFEGELEKVTDEDAWSGNRVYRANFSEVQNEGEYFLSITGIGKSDTFSISKE